MDILFLHDTHSHLESFVTMQNGDTATVGGFPQIKTLINEAKAGNPDTLVVDAGDFSMGTLVQTIFASQSAELRMLGELGCEVTTLGNHEFDYRSQGLAGSLYAAAQSGDPVPAMVLCNIDWEAMEAEGLTGEQQLLKDAFDAYGMADYTVITKGDVKIAVLGIFGEDSLACAPTCVLKFKDASKAAAETVAKIQANEDVDMILCVSHSGTNTDARRSEDEILAKNVPEIDLIISGHTHTTLEQPIRHGDTYIVSCGEYGKNLGSLSMRQRADGRWELTSYELTPITPAIAPDASTQQRIDDFMESVDTDYLSRFGYTNDQVLARNDIVFATSDDLYSIHTDHNLGNLLSDSFMYTVSKEDTGDSHPVDITIVPSGCVRDTFAMGDVTVADVFNAYSLGIGPDGVPGYPLISIYLTGAELKTGAEIDASLTDIMPSARMYMTGIEFSFNPHRLILNRVTDIYLTDNEGNRVEIEDDKLYRIVCDLYSGQMLGAVNSVSMGILSVQPKFADGTPIENIEDAVITTDRGTEIKAWAAIADYIGSFEDTDGDGISNVPAYYNELHGRKVVENSRNIIDLIKNPNKYAVIIVLAVILVLAILILLVVWIIKKIRNRFDSA
ncbi:MAG: 5'-nucleotidase C-terminal domain-containing protein [Firmicutes bacterium]|nr:5'-nucleotidase C-terminal domain-containing protein [Bacillota bacterium]